MTNQTIKLGGGLCQVAVFSGFFFFKVVFCTIFMDKESSKVNFFNHLWIITKLLEIHIVVSYYIFVLVHEILIIIILDDVSMYDPRMS